MCVFFKFVHSQTQLLNTRSMSTELSSVPLSICSVLHSFPASFSSLRLGLVVVVVVVVVVRADGYWLTEAVVLVVDGIGNGISHCVGGGCG